MNEFLIWSNQQRAWWAPEGRGYTPYIEAAGRYSHEAARRLVAKATCNGQLVHTVKGPRGEPVRILDEVMVPAPRVADPPVLPRVPPSGHRDLGPDTGPVDEQIREARDV
jgi:hypothetical protein